MNNTDGTKVSVCFPSLYVVDWEPAFCFSVCHIVWRPHVCMTWTCSTAATLHWFPTHRVDQWAADTTVFVKASIFQLQYCTLLKMTWFLSHFQKAWCSQVIINRQTVLLIGWNCELDGWYQCWSWRMTHIINVCSHVCVCERERTTGRRAAPVI